MMQGQRELDQAGHSSRGLGVTEIGFDRTDVATLLRIAIFAKHRGQRAELHRIAGARSRTVRFE